ncbi:DUF4138 domain-containing protein [Flexithrix dorotheae]|uniref:DUF4138 domain-containing protein n=1 Tax=Flexithrix dorotheae TaxID=70993 RepID=UPI00036056D3|nr:DUF4138 domain-containing protein [Flexithrix dorotheae]
MQLLNKKFIIGLLGFILGFYTSGLANSHASNGIDTIFLSTDVMTVVIFEESISFYNVGSTDFGFEHAGNKFILYAKTSEAGVSSLFLESGDGVFQALIAYKAAPSKLLYDFRANPKRIQTLQSKNLKPENKPKEATSPTTLKKEKDQATHEKLELVQQDKQRYRSLGTKENDLLLLISSIRVDQEAIYLKLVMENQSSMDYEIDLVTFEIESKQKGFGPGGENTRAMKILESQAPSIVEKEAFATLLYALPSFAGGNGEHLKITLREKKGSRTMSVSVPFQVIRKAKTI